MSYRSKMALLVRIGEKRILSGTLLKLQEEKTQNADKPTKRKVSGNDAQRERGGVKRSRH